MNNRRQRSRVISGAVAERRLRGRLLLAIVALCATMLAAVPTPAGAVPGAHEPAVAHQRDQSATVQDLFAHPSLHRGHAVVLRLYWAALGREPELGGALWWVDFYDEDAWDVRRIAAHFVASEEFVSVYGELTDAEFVTLVYGNVLERQPDQGGFDFWVGQLGGGMSRAELVLLMSNDDEFVGRHPLPADDRPDIGPGAWTTARAEAVIGARALAFL